MRINGTPPYLEAWADGLSPEQVLAAVVAQEAVRAEGPAWVASIDGRKWLTAMGLDLEGCWTTAIRGTLFEGWPWRPLQACLCAYNNLGTLYDGLEWLLRRLTPQGAYVASSRPPGEVRLLYTAPHRYRQDPNDVARLVVLHRASEMLESIPYAVLRSVWDQGLPEWRQVWP